MFKATVISPQQAIHYYRQENYYSEEESQQNSQWYGQGAEKLGLRGHVKSSDFSGLLHGELPNGEKFRKRPPTHSEYKERAGVDLTFSAPKSVSLAVLVNGDKQLEEAHRQAVKTTLQIAEERYTSTRIRANGERKTVNTGNLIVAQFHHDSSREKDPQLHTHAVALNATRSPDGKWYSLKNDAIFSNQKLLGTIYQNELANRAKKLGYEIEQKGNSQFELKGYTQEQLEHFSKRRSQIIEAVGADASAKQRELASLKTRKPKGKEISREQLLDYWQAEARIIGIQHPQPQQVERKKGSHSTLEESNKSVREAIAHASERNVNFKKEELEKFILTEIGANSWGDIQNSINSDRDLLKAKDNKYTTVSALNRELDSIRMVSEGKDAVVAVSDSETIQKRLQDREFTTGQKNAIAQAATTEDRFIAWQGKAGAGKTYALREFKSIAEDRGYTIKGYAPSASAAKVLGEELGIESNTVARKLVSQPLEQERSQQQIWIVDEAGLLSAKDTHNLLQRAEAERARVLLVGDTRQLSSVEAGNPFKSLQRSGMDTAYLNQSMRQKTQDLKEAVNKISEGQITEGVGILDDNGRIKEVGDKRAEQIANDYLNLNSYERKQTLILAGTNADREDILRQIRDKLKEEGTLGKETQGMRLKSKDLTSIQNKYAHHYFQGDVVMPLTNNKKLGLEKGKLYTVSNVKGDKLELKTNNNTLTVDPNRFHKAVFEKKQIDVAQGDRLKWTKNDAFFKRRNGQEFEVAEINNNLATIQYDNGKTEQIDLNQPQTFDHALVSTTYSSQGKTANRVLVSATSDKTLSKESFYVAASRAKYNLDIYTQDKEQLQERSKISQAKQNPLEVLDLDRQSAVHQEIKERVDTKVRNTYDRYVERQIKDDLIENRQQQGKDLVTKSKDNSSSLNSSPPIQQQPTNKKLKR